MKRRKGTAKPKVRESAGSRELGDLCVQYGPTAIAKKIGVTSKAIHFLATGKRSPSPTTRIRLAKTYALAVERWDEPPPEAAPLAIPAPPKLEPTQSTIVEAEANLAAAKAARDRALADPNASHRDRSSAAAAVDRAIRSLSDARGEADISEARIANSPAWARLSKAVVEALKPVPGALQAFLSVCQHLVETE